jgi:hypothetical protein
MMFVIVSELRGIVRGPFSTYGAARSHIEKDMRIYYGWTVVPLYEPLEGSFDPDAKRCDYHKEDGTQCLRTADHPVEGGLPRLGGHDFYIGRNY